MARANSWRLLCVLLLTLSLMAGFVRFAEAQDVITDENQVRGYALENGLSAEYNGTVQTFKKNKVLYVGDRNEPNLTPANSRLVYCFNGTQEMPPELTESVSAFFTRQAADNDLFHESASTPKLSKEELGPKILSIIYNGYDNDAAGLMEKFQLSPMAFYKVTQDAVWYYTDHQPLPASASEELWVENWRNEWSEDTELNDRMAKAMRALIGADSSVELKEAPAGNTLNLHLRPEGDDGYGKLYQNLLGATFVKPHVPTPAGPAILGTTVAVPGNSAKELAANGGKVVDTVEYKGLTIGEDYVVVGELMEKGKYGETVVTNIKSKSAAFQPVSTFASDTVNVEFDIPAGWHNRTMVVFERLYKADAYGNPVGDPIAVHEDITDEKQTFTIADADNPITLGTLAKDKADEDKSVESGGTIVDTVTYTGLKPNTQYTLIAMLVKKEGFDPEDPQPVDVKNQTFTTSDDPDGFVDVELTAPTVDKDSDFVVFEYLFEGVVNPESGAGSGEQKFIKSHDDIDDAGQTVTVTAPIVPDNPDTDNPDNPDTDNPDNPGTDEDDDVPPVPDTNGSSKWGWIIALIVGVVGLIGLGSAGSSGSSGSSTPEMPKTPKPSQPKSETPTKPGEAQKPGEASMPSKAPQLKQDATAKSAPSPSRGIAANTGANVSLGALAMFLMVVAGLVTLRRRHAQN